MLCINDVLFTEHFWIPFVVFSKCLNFLRFFHTSDMFHCSGQDQSPDHEALPGAGATEVEEGAERGQLPLLVPERGQEAQAGRKKSL